MRKPTRWDAQVPAIFWANAAWKAAHPDAWQMLQANARRPLMHADLVPTLLAAADIAYRDKRRLPVNLLAEPVAPRERFVEKALQVRVGWQTLLRDAEQSAFPRGD